jgi:hypothetical protein
VPGYRLRGEPLFDDEKVTVFIEVEGAGDYLPRYAGNLDIMTSAAVRVGEDIARRLLAGSGGLKSEAPAQAPDRQAKPSGSPPVDHGGPREVEASA